MEKKIKWWQNALVYQIYPLSFKDSNNDGIGDIKGIIQKLSYLKDLGVDVIWLSPVYQSPMDDNGYDISDYYQVNPMFGTFNDLIELIKQTHHHGMRIIMDLVVNHTSDLHPWFIDAKSSRKSKYRNYYIWSQEPTPSIGSVFSGSAWEYDQTTQAYYFHLFSKRQPDLNWQNPHLRSEIYQMMNYWLDLGIDGFRMDVIDLIGKDVKQGRLSDGPFLETFLSEMNEECFKGRDIMNVGEMGGISQIRAKELTSNEKLGMNMTFQFTHLSVDEMPNQGKWNLKPYQPYELKQILIKNQQIFQEAGWNSLFLSNHDQPRQVSRFGDLQNHDASAKCLLTMLYCQRGTPFLYMGEELGMTGVRFESIDQYQDIETKNYYHSAIKDGIPLNQVMASIYAKSRDNSRTPFQWDESPYAGFSSHQPWLAVNDNYHQINLAKQLNDPSSIYQYTKELFLIRKKYPVFTTGEFISLKESCRSTFIYLRVDQTTSALVVTNLTNQVVIHDLSEYHDYLQILGNQTFNLNKNTTLKPYQCGVFIKEESK